MKQYRTIPLLLFCLCLLLFPACASKEEKEIRKEVEKELDGLKETEPETIQDYLDTEGLFSEFTQEDASSALDIGEIFTLFYQNFSYEIKKVTAEETHAEAKVKITTLDMQDVAKDYMTQSLKKRITLDATPSSVDFSLNDSYLLLEDLLRTNEYETSDTTAVIQLEKEQEQWEILHTRELDDALTGNFRQYMMDSSLLSPSEIVEIHFQTIKDFDSEQLKIYLSLDQLLDTDTEYNRAIAHAVAEQISRVFDYEVLSEKIQGKEATVQISITSVNPQSTLADYSDSLSAWLKTSESLAVGEDGRREKERELLLAAIENSTDTTTRKIKIHLENDGVNWKIQMDSAIAQAVFGDIQTAMEDVSEDVE